MTPNPRGYPRQSGLRNAVPPTREQLKEDRKHWSFDESLRTKAKPQNRGKGAKESRAARLFAELQAMLTEKKDSE